MKIAVVEDNFDTADRIVECIESSFPNADVLWFPSSKSFSNLIEGGDLTNLDLIVLDLSLIHI